MTDAEKTEREIDPTSRVQVLTRNTNGKITAYRLVLTDADIITKY